MLPICCIILKRKQFIANFNGCLVYDQKNGLGIGFINNTYVNNGFLRSWVIYTKQAGN